ncbi:endonuclease 4 [Candidatus Lokiarchaeum ossiferum]|uniref:Endonuclease 4 n=1 Tax=Candidatus Lokiarchaeum ossiferum TaxID=2951803 RepID=A0ABY6HNR0_9ARCH|nr:endonuclease 4 [Candidatus Lokiarchaeum sp. B-35]
MNFENHSLRIGPTGAKKELFFMPGRGGKLRKGKREELPEYFAKLGLNAYEFPAGRMSHLNDGPAYQKLRENSTIYDVAISLHAPYYISLTSDNEETFKASIERIAHAYAWATYLNAHRIVLHPGTFGDLARKLSPNQLIKGEFHPQSQKKIHKIIQGISAGIERSGDLYPNLKEKFRKICICPETMGKHGQIGPTPMIIQICKDIGVDKVRPCIDFGHLYARNVGKLQGRKLYETVFQKIEEELGSHVLQHLHIHYSKIEYTQKGEKKHVGNTDSLWGPEIKPLLEIIQEQSLTPTIINESPELEPDAVQIMKEWKNLRK